MFIFSVFFRLWGSHLLLSASTYFMGRVLSARVICILPHLGILFFIRLVFYRSSFFLGGVFCCYALVPGTLALDMPSLISDVWFFWFFSVSRSVATEFVSLLWIKNEEGH